MLWPIRLALRVAWRLKLIVLAAAAGFAVGMLQIIVAERRSWGVVPADAARALPGDDLITAPDVSDTRSLRIDAPPEAVWPWLAQLGYGRGGWYSYDQIDMDGSSADVILPEFQSLAEGDVVPTYPDGGFVARVVEPGKALVLYLDSELVQQQLEAASASETAASEEPLGLQAAGALGSMSMADFRASWAFSLLPEADGSTRLVERMRFATGGGGGPLQVATLPVMGLGVFVMTRKHMLGLKERAERAAREGGPSET
ncbi:MAG: hypothetical protein PVG27_02455 [Chloroflexota bacterium]|jgi:hypothetical protein